MKNLSVSIGVLTGLWILVPAVACAQSDAEGRAAYAYENGEWDDFDYIDQGDPVDGAGTVEVAVLDPEGTAEVAVLPPEPYVEPVADEYAGEYADEYVDDAEYDEEPDPIVHEAFVDHGDTVRVAKRIYVDSEPPPVIHESVIYDTRPSTDAIWIPGYWYHVPRVHNYVWVSGCWRIPPSGMAWRSGQYMAVGTRWAWVPGCWTPANASLTYYPSAPPAFRLEIVNHALCPSPRHVWAAGHWKWSHSRYSWFAGTWVLPPAGHVYVAPRYHWTPRGYAFVAGYFDRPVVRRGVAYRPIVVRHPRRIQRIKPRSVYRTDRLEGRRRHARPAHRQSRRNLLVQGPGSSARTVRRSDRASHSGRSVSRQQGAVVRTPRPTPLVVPRKSTAGRKPHARPTVKPRESGRGARQVVRAAAKPTRVRSSGSSPERTGRQASPTATVRQVDRPSGRRGVVRKSRRSASPTPLVARPKPGTAVQGPRGAPRRTASAARTVRSAAGSSNSSAARRSPAPVRRSPKRTVAQRSNPSRGSSPKVSRSSRSHNSDRQKARTPRRSTRERSRRSSRLARR